MAKSKKKDAGSSKDKNEDNKQAKISTFFKNKPEATNQSSLFTSIQTTRAASFDKKSLEGKDKNVTHKKPIFTKSITGEKDFSDGDIVCLDVPSSPPKNISTHNFKSKGTTCAEASAQERTEKCEKRKPLKPCSIEGSLNSDESNNSIISDFTESSAKKKCPSLKNQPTDVQDVDQKQEKVVVTATGTSVQHHSNSSKQDFSTPKKREQVERDADSSPEIIFDTPGVDPVLQAANAQRRKLYSNRSFLRASHLLGVQPDLKPAHLRNQKCRAKKKMGLVSVTFNDAQASDNAEDDRNNTKPYNFGKADEKTEEVKKFIAQEGAVRKGVCMGVVPETQLPGPGVKSNTNMNRGCNDDIEDYDSNDMDCINTSVFDQSSHQLDKAVDLYISALVEDADSQNEKAENQIKEKGSDCSDTTPTKLYPGKTTKRQAKPGFSSDPKRAEPIGFTEICNITECSDVSRLDNAKKMLDMNFGLSPDKKPVPKKKTNKFTFQRAVELGLKPTKPEPTERRKVTLSGDQLLSDLLDSVNSSASKQSKSFKHTVTKKDTHANSNILKKKKAGDVVSSKMNISKEDEELLNMLTSPSTHNEKDDFLARTPGSDLNTKSNTQQPCTSMQTSDTQNDCIIIESDTEKKFINIEGDTQNECIIIGSLNLNVGSSNKKSSTRTCASEKTQESLKISPKNNSTENVKILNGKEKEEKQRHADTTIRSLDDKVGGESTGTEKPFEVNKDGPKRADVIGCQPNKPTEEDTDYHLSTSVCDMLSDSFNDDFLLPAAVKKETDFVFTDLWNRFTVTGVSHSRDAMILQLFDERKGSLAQCIMRGFWADTTIIKGDTVNIISEHDSDGVFTVDDKKGLVVVNPDVLLSGTLVVSSVFCPRKSVLNEKFKGVDKGNIHMMYGSFLHNLFQEVVKQQISTQPKIQAMAEMSLKSNKFLHEMYGNNVAENAVMKEVALYIPSIISWLAQHTSLSKTSNMDQRKNKRPDLQIIGIQDIEENIWSPRLGLKGKIDMTVRTELKQSNKSTVAGVLPLELKTGKASFSVEHKGQVTLYSMMSADRRQDSEQGILLYLKQGQQEVVPVKPQSQSGLIQLRNRLASDLSSQVKSETQDDGSKLYTLGSLPPPINNPRACTTCAHLLTCSIYQRSVEKLKLPPDHAMSKLVPEALEHLNQDNLAYFVHWMLLMGLEVRETSRKQLRPIWCSSSVQREREGECLSNLVVTGSELGAPESQAFNDGKGCCLTLSRHSKHPGPELDMVGLTVGDMVVLSSEDGRYIALATGFIRGIWSSGVEIVVDRDYLHNSELYKDIKFRLDRNDGFSVAGYLYTNLAKLMEPSKQGKWLRELIIDKRPPEFVLKVSKAYLLKVKSIFKTLNRPQRTAILKVVMAKDYVLIRGYPGTGKTSTIVALVNILHLLGLSVLLTSYTNSAVDNILIKLKKAGIPFLRLGRQGKIHPSIVPNCAEVLTRSPSIDSVQALTDFYNSYSVVATSCLSVSNHQIFSQRHFDVCIVDEASQVLQPACLGPLFHCNKFVLVGDPLQLAPVVQSAEARNLGMDESLFAKLDDKGATYDLNVQYRMNRVIMDLSNKLVYEGKLECGNETVAEQTLQLDTSLISTQPQWVQYALSSEIQNSVVFIDTNKINAPEKQDGKGIRNETEAEIILTLLKQLMVARVSPESVGVVSPYRSQVQWLQHKVKANCEVSGVEVNTVDQYQGRDKDAILVSFVRSDTNNDGKLLKDVRRLNVALTRARSKIILVGNTSALKMYEHLASIIQWLGESNNIVEIPDVFTINS